jgi:hypothetical protein
MRWFKLETAILDSIGVDKLQHFFFCTLTAFVLAVMVCLIPPFTNGFQRICTVWFSLILIGMLEEYRQLLIPERTTEWLDAIANILGVSVGVILPLFIHLKWQRYKGKDAMLKQRLIPLGAVILFVLSPLLYGLTVMSESIPSTNFDNKVLPVQNVPQDEIQNSETKIKENSLTPEENFEKYLLKLEETWKRWLRSNKGMENKSNVVNFSLRKIRGKSKQIVKTNQRGVSSNL